MSEEEKTIEDVTERINRCKECKFATCEQCEINWTEIKTVEHLLDFYKQEKEKNSKAIGHIEACKTNLGNYILSPSEIEFLLKLLKGE